MPYVAGFVLAVPKANKAAYRKMACPAAEAFRDHGATRRVECRGDDVAPFEPKRMIFGGFSVIVAA